MTLSNLPAKTAKLTQLPGNIVSDMDGEKVMLNVKRGKYYNLGEVGGEIWDLLASPVTAKEIVDALAERYDVEYALCEEQVHAFLAHLREEELLIVAEELPNAARA